MGEDKEAKQAMKTRTRLDNKEFIEAWGMAESLAEFEEKTGIKKAVAAVRACRLRKEGVPLKSYRESALSRSRSRLELSPYKREFSVIDFGVDWAFEQRDNPAARNRRTWPSKKMLPSLDQIERKAKSEKDPSFDLLKEYQTIDKSFLKLKFRMAF